MLFNRTPEEKSGLDEVIDNVQEEMLKNDPFSDDFAKMTDQLDKLYKIKSNIKKDDNRVSKDVLVTVGANLAGILMILSYEHVHPVTSKALGFVLKTKA